MPSSTGLKGWSATPGDDGRRRITGVARPSRTPSAARAPPASTARRSRIGRPSRGDADVRGGILFAAGPGRFIPERSLSAPLVTTAYLFSSPFRFEAALDGA